MEADTTDRAATDIMDSAEATTEDVEEVDAEAGEEDRSLKRHKTQTYLQSADNPHHYSGVVEEVKGHYDTHQTPQNDSTTGTIASRADLTSKTVIRPQHAHEIGAKLGIRKDAPGTMYNSTLWPDKMHQ